MFASGPVVRIATGEIAGRSRAGVREFRGIPYAAAPAGPLRWRPPEPAEGWSGVRDAGAFGPDPVQIVRDNPAGRSLAPGVSEDCLNLNLWAPERVPPGGAPVIVGFAGGGYVSGSASRDGVDGYALARRGVVLVTVNYRVGAFGFLAHPALTAESPQRSSGNYGLLDAIAGLRWVRDNVAAFGGDPERVTTIGGSAGAAIAALLLTSPLAAGLARRTILRSPSSLRPLPVLAEAEAAGRAAAGDDLAALRALPAADVLALNGRIDAGARSLLALRRLRPIVDGWVIPRDEGDAYRNGAFDAVPAIVGCNADEGRSFLANAPLRTVAELRAYLAANFGPLAAEAWRVYGVRTDAGVADAAAAMWGDAMFSYGVRGLARAFAAHATCYRYVFAYAGASGASPPIHGDEVRYAFGTGAFDARDRAISDALVAAFANFAATGDPNGPDAPAWSPYDPERDNHLTFAERCSAGSGFRAAGASLVERYYAETTGR